MNIFLDTNVIWKDPFFSKGRNAILLRLSKHEDVTLYINETVYQETLRGHKKFLDNEINSIYDSVNKLSTYLNEKHGKVEITIKTENLISDFHDYFDELFEENQIECIRYDSDVLSHLVEVDAYSQAPFVKQEEVIDKNGNKKPIIKKEIRDAIIWYSYKTFIEKSDIKDCYFITNNTKDFGAPGANKTPKDEPYPLHPKIKDGVDIIAYRTVHDFLTDNDEKVKELFKNEYLHSRILSEDFYQPIRDELEKGLAKELVERYFDKQIHKKTENYLSRMQPEDIHLDYFMDGYIEPTMLGEISAVHFQELDIYGDTIAVAVDVDVDMEVDIYLYNPVHDGREDKYNFQTSDTVKVEESIVFLISMDIEKELDIENFSFQDYIKGLEPDHLNIEFLKHVTLNHSPMFEEEYELPE